MNGKVNTHNVRAYTLPKSTPLILHMISMSLVGKLLCGLVCAIRICISVGRWNISTSLSYVKRLALSGELFEVWRRVAECALNIQGTH